MPCGIYAILSPSGKMYIGSSFDISRRWHCHCFDLRQGKGHSGRLQKAWDKYGGEGFSLVILEECPREMLFEREQHWIDALKPRYNARAQADRNDGNAPTKEARAKMSKARKAHLAKPGVLDGVRETASRTWQDPDIAAKRVAGMKWSEEKKARVSVKMKGKDRDALVRARTTRWADPEARKRQSEKLRAARAARPNWTS